MSLSEPVRRERLRELILDGPSPEAFVALPGGRFRMGSEARADEQPIHEVSVGPFRAALAPVSNAEYARFLEASGHESPRFWDDAYLTEPDYPVVGVNWFDAVAYCDWLSERTALRCRLPTEAEREFAALGGCTDGRAYPWGDEPWTEGPFALGSAGMDRPIAIGSTEPNGYGLYHMADNVHEWCSDWYDPKTYTTALAEDPRGPEDGARRASRGGSWRHRVKVARIAARSSLLPEQRYNDYGFRVYADL